MRSYFREHRNFFGPMNSGSDTATTKQTPDHIGARTSARSKPQIRTEFSHVLSLGGFWMLLRTSAVSLQFEQRIPSHTCTLPMASEDLSDNLRGSLDSDSKKCHRLFSLSPRERARVRGNGATNCNDKPEVRAPVRLLRCLSARPGVKALLLAFTLTFAITPSGCTTKAKARTDAKAAYLAGQQQAMERILVTRNSVTVIGPVRNPLVPWTQDLTLAKALVASNFYAKETPRGIVIVRGGQPMPVDPKQLLAGDDVPLEAGDVVQIR